MSKITDLAQSKNGNVTWSYNSAEITKTFKGDIFAYLIDFRNEILILADSSFDGPKNLFIYNADGTIRLNPTMPTLKKLVQGVYAVWFVEGETQLEVVLITEEYAPYDTGCTFNLCDGSFSNFHPTK